MLAIIFLLCTGVVAYIFFYPRSYSVSGLKKRPGTKYWQLQTGSRIAYTHVPAKGDKKPFPLIYLHGGPGAGITDLEIKTLGRLADYGYDVYLYDQVGCGHSGRFENINDYTANRHKKDLEEIVELLGVKKVILLGQSWGSILSVMYLADNLSKVEKLVITAPAPIQPENKAYAAIANPDSLQLRQPLYSNGHVFNSVKNPRARAMEFWMRRFGKKLVDDEEADNYATYYANYLNRSMVCDTVNAVKAEGTEGYYVNYMTRLSLGKVSDPRLKLVNCTIPVLVMKAQCDNQKWGYTSEYLDLFRNHQFALIGNAGHNIFIEQPDAYINTIKNFIEK